ncbi:MAG: hypothetical protein AB1714_12730 [Acidobacteriota bacterium]
MSFEPLLTELLEGVDGAISAAMFDAEGEMVQIVGRKGIDRHRLQLIGAYESIFHRQLLDMLALSPLEKITCHFTWYSRGIILTYPLGDGYLLQLYGEPDCNVGQAFHHMRAAYARILAEM